MFIDRTDASVRAVRLFCVPSFCLAIALIYRDPGRHRAQSCLNGRPAEHSPGPLCQRKKTGFRRRCGRKRAETGFLLNPSFQHVVTKVGQSRGEKPVEALTRFFRPQKPTKALNLPLGVKILSWLFPARNERCASGHGKERGSRRGPEDSRNQMIARVAP